MVTINHNMPSASKYESGKVSQNHLSDLMRFILLHAADGIERGEIAEHFYGLDRRYRGFYTDPCMPPKHKRAYERRYRRVQPVITRTLKRLQNRGLIELRCHGQYVKEIHLTAQGRVLLELIKE